MNKRLAAAIILCLLALPGPLFLPDHIPVSGQASGCSVCSLQARGRGQMLRMAKVTKETCCMTWAAGTDASSSRPRSSMGPGAWASISTPSVSRKARKTRPRPNVGHLVKFLEQDLFEADFHEATVVSLYLLTSVNLRLRPNLLTQLRPGTRIVSHNYAMDTWKPDDSAIVMVNNQSHNVYLWIVPANVSGAWEWTWAEGDRKVACALNLEQHFQWPAGELKVDGRAWSLRDVSLKGNELQFKAESEERGKTQTMTLTGRIVGNTLEGSTVTSRLPASGARAWKAKRNPVTMKPLDSEGPAYYMRHSDPRMGRMQGLLRPDNPGLSRRRSCRARRRPQRLLFPRCQGARPPRARRLLCCRRGPDVRLRGKLFGRLDTFPVAVERKGYGYDIDARNSKSGTRTKEEPPGGQIESPGASLKPRWSFGRPTEHRLPHPLSCPRRHHQLSRCLRALLAGHRRRLGPAHG